ncbi:hypothetical protein PO587_38955 [Streptomyces gilvifuscus]|uniref:Uncharacterized protein n=1 Tax=Streptomyces gilvifuscus TaxID=1550617 RepID=A0ABT5G6D3_9ACTN|nr:hypothetical protein [Streptomyces gilvifuscus]MDC2960420.1 hypothetical protein [Streptomyces gilvifuscus]
MTDAVRVRAALAYLCERASQIRRTLQTGGDGGAPLEAVFASVRSHADDSVVLAALENLEEALLMAGDALGLPGVGEGVRGPLGAAGTDSRQARERVLVCPQKVCGRFEWPSPDPPPRCEVFDRDLARDRL